MINDILRLKEEIKNVFLNKLQGESYDKRITYKEGKLTITTDDFSLVVEVKDWDKVLEKEVIKYINE